MRLWFKRLLFIKLALLITGVFCFNAAAEQLVVDDFENGLDPRWEERVFAGSTRYEIVSENGSKVLEARSVGTASGLIFPREYQLQDYPFLSWRWKIKDTLPRGDARTKAGDDYPARVYVVFPHWLFFKTRSINYIWSNTLPQGEIVPSPYTGNSVMVAVRSGPELAGRWVSETRNVLEDYRRIFQEEPPPVGAIAVMTDADNTQGSALAWYDDILIARERP